MGAEGSATLVLTIVLCVGFCQISAVPGGAVSPAGSDTRSRRKDTGREVARGGERERERERER